MKLLFTGTRGYIKVRTERHRMHASCRVTYRHTTLVLDRGEDWLGVPLGFKTDAILVSHAHPDHAWGLKKGAPCPVYASEDSWSVMRTFAIDEPRLAPPREPITLKDITFEAFKVEHSTRAPAVGYRVTAGRHSIFYAPDLVYIYDRAEALRGVDTYIGDGATVARPMVRKRDEALIGHVPVRTQLTWCQKEGVPAMIVTHCGAQIVGAEDESAVIARIEEFARERGVRVIVAYDGMELVLR
ncbi:MAG: MBL fold metallo-hydrolase [Candidatus Geothermincolia bacterium]